MCGAKLTKPLPSCWVSMKKMSKKHLGNSCTKLKDE